MHKQLSKKHLPIQPIPQQDQINSHQKLSTMLQKTNQKMYKNIQFGIRNLSESIDIKKKRLPFHLDMNKFGGNLQNYIRNIKSSIEQQKKMKRQLQKTKQKQAKQFLKKIKNPQTIERNYNLKNQLKNKSKSEGILKVQNNSQLYSSLIKIKKNISQSNKNISSYLQQNINQRASYVYLINSMISPKNTQLPPLFKQKLKSLGKKSSKQSELKTKKNVEQTMEQIIFKKLNNDHPQIVKLRSQKDKWDRVQDGNNMLRQSLKGLKSKSRLQRQQEKQRIKTQNEQINKSKIIGDRYLKESLQEIRLPLQKFIQQRHLQSLQMENYIKIARQERKKQQEQKWSELMNKIINKQIDKYEGLIKIGTIQRRLVKLGDDADNRLALKCSILHKHNIE